MKWEIFAPSFSPESIVWEEGRLLKDRPHRRVWLFEDFVVKAFRQKPLQRDQARKEAELGRALAGLSPDVLAYGRKGSWRYVVTRRIRGEDLGEFLRRRYSLLPSSAKKTFWVSFSRFLRGLIDRGIFQPDFHLGNVLVAEGSAFEFYLIDLHRAHRRSYDEVLLKRQLAYLLPPLRDHLSWWETGRLTHYLSKVFPALRRRSFRLAVQKEAHALMRRHFARRERRLKKEFSPGLPAELPFPEELFKQTVLVKDSRVTKTGHFPAGEPRFWVKAYVGKGFNGIWQGRRVERAFFGAYRLENRGVRTILPLAYWKARALGGTLRGLVVYPYLPEVRCNWGAWWKGLSARERESFLCQLVRFLWEMHERGIFHGDAKISNFFVQEGELGVFDLDAVRFSKRPLSLRERLKDLATLVFSLLWLSPEEGKELIEKGFRFYAFLSGGLEERDLERFRSLVEKRRAKRLAKERGRAA